MKIGVMFGSPETTTGGNALKFYASMRLDVRRIGALKNGEDVVGNRTRVKVVKNKLAPPFREAEFDVKYGLGVDRVSEVIDLGIEQELIEKSGSHLSFAGTHLGNGRERARDSLCADVPMLTRLTDAVRVSLATSRVAPGAAAQVSAGDAE